MKKFNAPELVELNINETAGGFLNIGIEGPFNVLFGDKSNNGGDNKDDTTPGTEEES